MTRSRTPFERSSNGLRTGFERGPSHTPPYPLRRWNALDGRPTSRLTAGNGRDGSKDSRAPTAAAGDAHMT
jgi:hypothetical protein